MSSLPASSMPLPSEAPSAGDSRPEPLGLGQALALWGISLALMLLLAGTFYVYVTRKSAWNAPLFATTVTLCSVLMPTLIALWGPWRRSAAGAPVGPGRLPAYTRPAREAIGGVVLVSLPLYVLSAAVSIALGAWEPLQPTPAGPASAAPTPATVALYGLAWVLLPAFAEELMYRGAIQPAIVQRWGPAWGIGITAVLFAFAHMEPAGLLPRVLLGVWFGWLAWRTGSLWAPTLAHGLNNTWSVALWAAPGVTTTLKWPVLALAVSGLAGALWCFHLAGWLRRRPPDEPG